jgi:uncharacterized protein (DUF58 family)
VSAALARAHRGVALEAATLIALKAAVDELKLARRLKARATVDGGHLSRQRGRSTDYQESRAYQPGDDVRLIDWRLSARQPRLYTKVYAVERERPVLLLIDFSESMLFATKRTLKSIVAAEAATAIAWATIARGDRVGALVMPDFATIKPSGGSRSALRLIDGLVGAHRAALSQPRVQDWPSQLTELKRLIRPGTEVYLLTDGSALAPSHAPLLGAALAHASLKVIRISDASERSPPPPGAYQFFADGRAFRLDLSGSAQRRVYAQALSVGDASFGALCAQLGLRPIELDTRADVVSVLAQELR